MPKTSKIKSLASGKRLFIVGMLLLAVAAFFWWTKVFNNPKNVFWGMLENSLATSSVTRISSEQTPDGSFTQLIRLQTGAVNASESREITTQGGTTVVKENIGTPADDLVRYASIDTVQTSATGNQLEFAGVEGVWGVAPTTGTGSSPQAQYFTKGILSMVLFGSLPAGDRSDLVKLMREKNVYKVSYADVKKTRQSGHSVYEYNVKVNLADYFTLFQAYVKKMGLADVPGTDPNQYASSPDTELKFKIDKNSRQLLEIEYVSSGQIATFSDHGLTKPIVLPKYTIPISELQTRIQQLQ
jgi:hypothetical protein